MKKVLIAKIISVFGIKGEVKMIVYSDDPLQMEKYQLSDRDGNQMKIKFRSKTAVKTSSGNAVLIAKIDDIDDRDKAEKLRGTEIFVDRENFEQVSSGEFYYVDLIGLDVIDINSNKIGKVINVCDYGGGGVIEIEFSIKDLPRNYQPVENFSFRSQIFPEVNLEKNFIRIVLPEILTES